MSEKGYKVLEEESPSSSAEIKATIRCRVKNRSIIVKKEKARKNLSF